MAEHQKIHPVDVETPPPTAPLVPSQLARSEKGDPHNGQYPPSQPTTTPVTDPNPPKKKRSRSCCCKCLCWSLLTFIVFILLLGATVGILYLVFNPKIPKYSVDRLRITSFEVNNNLTAHASINVTVTTRNPNKKIGIYYVDGSHLSVLYSDTTLCTGSFPVFYQGHRNTTVLNMFFTGEAQIGSEAVTALQQQQNTGEVPLKIRGSVPVRVKFGGLKLWKIRFHVRCNLVVSSLNGNNQVKIKSSSCKFKLRL